MTTVKKAADQTVPVMELRGHGGSGGGGGGGGGGFFLVCEDFGRMFDKIHSSPSGDWLVQANSTL